MRLRAAEYECQAFPDGTWIVRYIHHGGERAETIGSGRVGEADRPIGESGLESAEQAAKDRVRQRKAEMAEHARIVDGAVTFTLKV
jgi:hypothetical protein